MKTKILLTSFQTWLPHQKSNSSDDLLALLQKQTKYSTTLSFLRCLPVNTNLASKQTIAKIIELQPDAIICCGMAEARTRLSVESNARYRDTCIYTAVNLSALITTLTATDISHDAGQFVCEGLYYQILKYTQNRECKIPCLFLHIPCLNENNTDSILQDLKSIILFLSRSPNSK